MRRSCDVCAAACTSMQSRPLIIAPICISCSLYACHQKRDPSITQTHGGKKRELFARGMEGDNLNRKKPIGSPISDSGEAINQPGSRQGRKSIDHGREPLSLGGMKPGPRSTHVHSPLPPHRIFDLIMEGSTEGRKIERERKKENPEPDNIPLKTKRLPLQPTFSHLPGPILPASLSLIIRPFSLTFFSPFGAWVVDGVDGGRGERRGGEGIYGALAPKGEGPG